LFASSPDRADWLEARGVLLLLDTAERMPDVTFRLLWRPWGDSLAEVQRQIRARGLGNVEVRCDRIGDMAAEYRQADATIAPFVDISRCKPLPNSLVESLACGVPVIMTNVVGLSDIAQTEKCGIVASDSPDSLSEAIRRAIGDRDSFRPAARRTAERFFSSQIFVENYVRIYGRLQGCAR
jgi:glycosyltransferase involved in cell wall biosynthesis